MRNRGGARRERPEPSLLKVVPWDVWIAIAVAFSVAVAAVLRAGPVLFIAMYVAMCAYVVVEVFGDEAN